MGVIQQVAATPAAALEAGIQIAEKIAACGPLSSRFTLQSAHTAIDGPERQALEDLEAQYSALYKTEDFIEGHKAYAEGRKPVFKGK